MVTILSERAIPDVRMTVDEFLDADLPEGQRYELVDGVVEMTPIPGDEHDFVVMYLTDRLLHYRASHPGSIAHVSQRSAILIPGQSRVREPDLTAYRNWEGKGRGTGVWKEFTPFLVVEVISRGQAKRDFVEKREDYWVAGVEEYWIADPIPARLIVLTRGATEWDEQSFDRPEQRYAPARLPGLEIEIGALFGS